MTELSIGEQRARAGLDSKGRSIRRGKPKNADEVEVDGVRYQVVGDDERVDPSEDEIEERRERHEARRLAQAQREKAARRSMPLHERLRKFAEATAALQAPRARAISPSGKDDGKDRPVLPPGGNDMELAHAHRQEVERRLRDIDMAIGRLEELLDAHRGLAPTRDFALMDSHEKNEVILTQFVGMRPEEVTAFAPELGAPRTIRWVRSEAGRRGVCGHRAEECTCQGVRKAPAKRAA